MPLILAIEPDSRQASLLSELARGLADAELILTTSASEAMKAFDTRMPDLILTSTLLSPTDEHTLMDRLRKADSSGAHVQTLVIPVLAESQAEPQQVGLLSRLGWRKPKASAPDGCDPAVFAGQITEYLKRAHVLRRAFTPLPASSLAEESNPILRPEVRPEPERVDTPPAPPASSVLLSDPVPALDWLKADESVNADSPARTEQPVLGVQRPRWAEPLVTDLHALGAELDAVLAAHAEPVDEVDPDPVDVAETSEEMFAEAESIDDADFEAPVEPVAHEPTALPTFRSDLLQLLEAIQLDLEPLRSSPEDRSSAPAKPAGNIQDEWGFFDPRQCGIAALLARLDQMAGQRDAGTGQN